MADQMRSYLDFEKPVAELEAKIDELRTLAANGSDIGDEITKIEEKSAQALAELYANLTPWQKTLVARHPQRPHFSDFIGALVTEFTPFAGDRKFGEDEALVGGPEVTSAFVLMALALARRSMRQAGNPA